jgi:hypothetical protein
MDSITKTIQNNVLGALGLKAPENVLNAIKKASAQTGVNFAYMLQQAGVESSFNPQAKAKTSSASGLYQFLSSTWMDMVGRYGEKYGIDTDGMSKKQILALRSDPEISAHMAAEFASENEQYLNKTWGGKVGSTELYLAHFMGAGGAAAFLKARDENALQPAADLMPQAARSNRNVFFDKSGRAKTIDEVYAFFDKKFTVKDFDLPENGSAGAEAIAEQSATLPYDADTRQEQTANALFSTSSLQSLVARKPAPSQATAGYGQIPAAYQTLMRSPIDAMLLSQLSDLSGKNDDNSLF